MNPSTSLEESKRSVSLRAPSISFSAKAPCFCGLSGKCSDKGTMFCSLSGKSSERSSMSSELVLRVFPLALSEMCGHAFIIT